MRDLPVLHNTAIRYQPVAGIYVSENHSSWQHKAFIGNWVFGKR
jgi:hypothetical protein